MLQTKDGNRLEVIKTKKPDRLEELIGEGIQILLGFRPILLDSYKGYNLVQYKYLIYAVPLSLGHIDLTREDDINHHGIFTARTRHEAQELIESDNTSKVLKFFTKGSIETIQS